MELPAPVSAFFRRKAGPPALRGLGWGQRPAVPKRLVSSRPRDRHSPAQCAGFRYRSASKTGRTTASPTKSTKRFVESALIVEPPPPPGERPLVTVVRGSGWAQGLAATRSVPKQNPASRAYLYQASGKVEPTGHPSAPDGENDPPDPHPRPPELHSQNPHISKNCR